MPQKHEQIARVLDRTDEKVDALMVEVLKETDTLLRELAVLASDIRQLNFALWDLDALEEEKA